MTVSGQTIKESDRLKEPTQMLGPGRHDVQAAMDQLAAQVQIEFTQPIRGVIAAPSRGQRYYWMIGLLAVVVGLVAFVGSPFPERRPVPSPPVMETVTVYETDACTQRQAAIVNAISAYTRDHGAAPDHLSDLAAGYLSEPAVDPASGAPYLYTHDSNSIALRCPNPELHAPARRVNQPQLAAMGVDR